MAQIFGFFEDNTEYTEGPFVVVVCGGYRIEMELKGHNCSVVTNNSIDRYLEKNGFDYHKSNDKEKICGIVDWLNDEVKKGNIILQEGRWVLK